MITTRQTRKVVRCKEKSQKQLKTWLCNPEVCIKRWTALCAEKWGDQNLAQVFFKTENQSHACALYQKSKNWLRADFACPVHRIPAKYPSACRPKLSTESSFVGLLRKATKMRFLDRRLNIIYPDILSDVVSQLPEVIVTVLMIGSYHAAAIKYAHFFYEWICISPIHGIKRILEVIMLWGKLEAGRRSSYRLRAYYRAKQQVVIILVRVRSLMLTGASSKRILEHFVATF